MNFTVGKIFRLGSQLTNFTVGVKYYAAGPSGALSLVACRWPIAPI